MGEEFAATGRLRPTVRRGAPACGSSAAAPPEAGSTPEEEIRTLLRSAHGDGPSGLPSGRKEVNPGFCGGRF